MDLFNDKEAFKDKVEDHRTINIPDDLGWDKMGPAILEGVKKRKKRRRLLTWWWNVGLIIIGISLLSWWFRNDFLHTKISTNELQIEATPSDREHKISSENNKDLILSIHNKRQSLIPDTQNIFEVDEFSINHNKEVTNTKLNTDLSEQVHTFIIPFIRSQNNKDIRINDTLAIETNVRRPIPDLSTERLPILNRLLSYENREVSIHTTPINKKTVSSKWQLEMAGGINWWEQGFTSEDPIQSINTPLNGWHFNARINRHLGKIWTLKLGLQFQHLRYKSAFENTTKISVYQPNTVDVIYNNTLKGEQAITYRDSIPGLQNRKFQHFNQHTTLEVPILAGFTLGKKRWKYSIHTGIGLQFIQLSTGRIALKNGTVNDLPDKTIYPNKLKLNYLLETQLAYQVTNKLSVFGRWGMERHFTNWLSLESQLQQHPKIGSSSFGVAWSF